MKTVKIKYPIKKLSKEKFERELLWYDGFYKKMRVFKGSHLKYKLVKEFFVEKENGEKVPQNETSNDDIEKYGVLEIDRIVAEAETIKILTVNNDKDINRVKDWLREYNNYNNIEYLDILEDADGIQVSIPEGCVEDFIYDAERHNFRFEMQ